MALTYNPPKCGVDMRQSLQAQCLGLCPTCGIDLNADPSHEHEADKDPRWSKLDELKFD